MKNQDKIKKLEKLLTSPHVGEDIKKKAKAEIEKLKVVKSPKERTKLEKEFLADISKKDSRKKEIADMEKMAPKKEKGLKSLLNDDPKKDSGVPNCDELLANFKKRKAQSKKYKAKAPKDAGDVLKKAVERSKTRIKAKKGIASEGEKTKIKTAITSLLDAIKNDKDLIKELISKLKDLLGEKKGESNASDKFKVGTPVYLNKGTKDQESGEVVMRDGKKVISLYKDKNYSGIAERIRTPDWDKVSSFYSN